MPSLMLVPLAVLEKLKQTERHTQRIALYILDFEFFLNLGWYYLALYRNIDTNNISGSTSAKEKNPCFIMH